MQHALKSNQTHQETGVVIGRSGSAFVVGTPAGQFEAERAVSCLVLPEVGDTVLLAVPPRGSLFVLAVLERRHEGGLSIESERDITLRTKGGLVFVGAREVETRSALVKTTAHRLETSGVEASWSFARLELVTGVLHANAERVKAVLGMFDAVLERASQHVKRSYKIVEELEMTRAKEVSLQVERAYRVRSQNTLMDAEQVVKVQAEQIHLG
jgi:hypothetical protein